MALPDYALDMALIHVVDVIYKWSVNFSQTHPAVTAFIVCLVAMVASVFLMVTYPPPYTPPKLLVQKERLSKICPSCNRPRPKH
jgi:hypothetical protein